MKTKKEIKINIITLGCSKNVVDSEVLMKQLKIGGYDVKHQNENEETDIVIINTCGFINDAKEESIDTIMQYVKAKESGLIKKLYVMGCLSQRYKNDLESEIQNVDGFYGTYDLKLILKDLNINYRKELIGERILTTQSHYAYLKISDGCDRNCSFCAIPLIKGKHKSRTIKQIVKESQNLADIGVKELILIAQDLTYYGIDIYNKRTLSELVQKLVDINRFGWIRLHYTYPAHFPAELLDVIKYNQSVCNYIDIPVQHISTPILKSMRRGITRDETYRLIEKIKRTIPEAALRTTLITGYPGETEDDFEELKQFIKDVRFDRLGVFTYSHEEDTKAYSLDDNILQEIKQQRADEIMEIQEEISLENNKAKVGDTLKVLIDREEEEYYVGRTEYDSPEIDNEVLAGKNEKIKIGEFYNVKIEKADCFDLFGTIT